MAVKKLKSGILLDVGARDRKESNFTGIDYRHREGVDIVHDLESFPYPFADDSCLTIKAAHVIEHIKPWLTFDWFNEMWRLLTPGGQLVVSAPFANSQGFFSDPTHITYINEATFQHLDPTYPMYKQYEPKPWKIEYASWQWGGNIEAILRKRDITVIVNIDLAQKAMLIGALQKPVELSAFIEFIRGLELKTVVEIGTARGGVFYVLCQLASAAAKLLSIDLPGGEFGGGYMIEDQKRFRSFAKGKQKLYFLRFDSHKLSTLNRVKQDLNGDKIDLLFIDGDHTYEGVKADFDMYSPLVRNGGLIAFHDICFHPAHPTCKVDQLWAELKSQYEHWEFIDPRDISWGGIGVIRKKLDTPPKAKGLTIARGKGGA
jgi:predicted O-methyltransferase YrrM